VIKMLLVAVWCSAMVAAGGYAADYVTKLKAAKEAAKTELTLETRKTRELSVPIIRDGAVKGYVVVQLNYVVDVEVAKKLPAPPDPFVIDETFQYIYGDDKIDFAHLDKLDLGKMTEELVRRVNTRLRTNVITDMGIIECNFLVNSEGSSHPKP
jgi:hypothetical protein